MTAVNPVMDLSHDGEVAVLTLDSPPVNALSLAAREGLFEGFTAALASEAKAIVLICAGRTFTSGADISNLADMMKGPSLEDIEGLMDGADRPIVAALHGTAFGGGLEIALCAHFRVAVASAKLALEDSGLEITEELSPLTGTIIGSGIGGMETYVNTVLTMAEKGPGRLSPFFITNIINNMAAGYVSIFFNAKGPNCCTTTACAASAAARPAPSRRATPSPTSASRSSSLSSPPSAPTAGPPPTTMSPASSAAPAASSRRAKPPPSAPSAAPIT